MNKLIYLLLGGIFIAFPILVHAGDFNLPALILTKGESGTQEISVSIQILAVMTALTLLPVLLLMMTSFTRIIIVLTILRQAMGLPQTPTNQILIGISLFLSLFIMTPVLEDVNHDALQPYLNEEISATQAFERSQVPFKDFMYAQTRESDLGLFLDLTDHAEISDVDDVPFYTLVPAFVTSELKTAFQIGFLLFIPFLVIDLVVASVLMAMGMMMLSPLIISLPFKIMLFVLVDGWALIIGTLASSFGL